MTAGRRATEEGRVFGTLGNNWTKCEPKCQSNPTATLDLLKTDVFIFVTKCPDHDNKYAELGETL